MRKSCQASLGTAALVAAATASLSFAQVPVERNDVIYGRNRSVATDSLQLIRGFPVGTLTSSQWSVPFIQSVQFDNLDGFRHAHFGNLLGLNFGAFATGGEVWNMETRFTAGTNPGAAERLFDFLTYNTNNPQAPLSVSRLNGLSVSPQNNRIAFTGSDNGNTYVLDYTPGNGTGTGGAVSNGREITNLPTGTSAGTTGTAWLDNNTVLALSPTGDLQRITVNNGSLSSANVANLTVAAGTSNFSSVAYEPTLSPYVYATVAKFDGATTTNRLFVLDPDNNFSVVKEVDYSVSIAAKSVREIGFDSNGNLYIGHFVNTTSTPAWASIALVQNAVNVGSLTDNDSTTYYTQDPSSQLSAQFSGLDVASTQLDYKRANVAVDLRARSHVQRFFGASPLAEVRAKVQAGYNGGAWNGVGIRSSNAAAQPGYAVGYGDAGDLGLIGSTFGGEAVPGPAVLFRLTRYGDATLDGTVNLADFNRLAANFGSSNAFWHRGDFNYDGLVNLQDFNLLAANFGLQAGPDGPTPDDWAALAAAVPEPAGLALASLVALPLLRRRRRA